MATPSDDNDDIRVRSLFEAEFPGVSDDGFSASVVRRIRVSLWQRRLILLTSLIAAALFAIPLLSQALLALTTQLVTLTAQAGQTGDSGQIHALLTMLPLREAASGLSDSLANVSTRVGSMEWLRQNQSLVLAGLLAVASLAATRLLE